MNQWLTKIKQGMLMAALCIVLTAVGSTQAQASIIFSDNFDAENSGVGVLNYYDFSNWSVSDGSVDLIGNGYFEFYPGNGLYVDLDGTSGDSGVFSSKSIDLAPGDYQLSFYLGGSTRSDINSVDVSLGSLYAETFTLASNDPFSNVQRTIHVSDPTTVNLAFANNGGDNLGLILDNVSIFTPDSAVVPEPMSMMLLGSGLLGCAFMRRKQIV